MFNIFSKKKPNWKINIETLRDNCKQKLMFGINDLIYILMYYLYIKIKGKYLNLFLFKLKY